VRQAEAEQASAATAEQYAVLAYVVKDLNEQLFVELMEGLHA
jgi:hypothetical protein